MTFDLPAERDKFIISNLGLVKSRVLALNKGIFNDDIFQVGSLALVEATDRFDKNKGCKFSTYAQHYIDGYIKNYKNYNSLIKPLVKRGGKLKYANIVSLDEPNEDGTLCFGDTICGCDNHEENILSESFTDSFMRRLSKKEREVIQLKLEGKTQKEIAKIIYIYQPEVSIIIKRVGERYKRCQYV